MPECFAYTSNIQFIKFIMMYSSFFQLFPIKWKTVTYKTHHTSQVVIISSQNKIIIIYSQ